MSGVRAKELLAAAVSQAVESGELDDRHRDLRQVADRLGVGIAFVPLPPSKRGQLRRDLSPSSKSGWRIEVNSADPVYVQRFTIAHEFGHLVLHGVASNRADDFDATLDLRGLTPAQLRLREGEANRFAADVLLPEACFRRLAVVKGANADWLSGLFCASRRTVELRASELSVSLYCHRTSSRKERLSDPYGLLS